MLSTGAGLGDGVLSGTDGEPDPPQEDIAMAISSVENIFMFDFLRTNDQTA